MGPQGEMMGRMVAPWMWLAGAAGLALIGWGWSATQKSPPPPAPPATAPVASPAPDVQSAVPDTKTPATPQVDTFTHDRDGSAVLAGRAPGSTRLEVREGETVLATATPDAAGRFAVLFELPPAAEARSLVLQGFGTDGSGADPAQLLIAPAQVASPVAPLAPVPADAPALPVPAPAPQPAAAPSNLLVSDSGVTVLRPPPTNGLSIDAIRYGSGGTVEVSGQAQAGSDVRLYLDNVPSIDLRADLAGHWQAQLPGVTPGLYTLRADQTGASGEVFARAETPFLRESAEALAIAPEGVSQVTVQPGFTLWSIARARFGDGQSYVKVFEANRAQIRDPDLIYPGQIFTLPTP